MATSMASASHICLPHASARGSPYMTLSACVSGDAKYCEMTPSIDSHPLSPQVEASVPISTTVPTRLYASSEKNGSIVAPLPEKNAEPYELGSYMVSPYATRLAFGKRTSKGGP